MGYQIYARNQIKLDKIVDEIRPKKAEINHTMLINAIIGDYLHRRGKESYKETFELYLKGEIEV